MPEPGSAADVVRVWDARADLYLRLFRHELDGKPLDQETLAAFAHRIGPGGRVYDAGCGPCGHTTFTLGRLGLDVVGIDLSPQCVELARLEHSECHFEVQDQSEIELDEPLDGLLSYYSLHDQPKDLLPKTLSTWASAIRQDGRLLIVAKEGSSDGVVDDPLGTDIRVYWAEFTADELRKAVERAGFDIDDLAVRDAYDTEIPTRRIYLAASRTRRSPANRDQGPHFSF